MILSPSILAADFNILGQQIEEMDEAGAQYVHIDVMDGLFVPSISFGMPLITSIRKTTKRVFDVHLMIMDPERYIDEFVKCGADIITFHLEATKEPEKVIELIKNAGCKVGLSIKPGTALEEAYPYMESIDMLLLMTVEPGFGGQKYIPESTDRIRKMRQYIEEHQLKTDLEIDGGINLDNIEMVTEAGANVIVAGSAVFRGNIGENVKAFLKSGN